MGRGWGIECWNVRVRSQSSPETEDRQKLLYVPNTRSIPTGHKGRREGMEGGRERTDWGRLAWETPVPGCLTGAQRT